MKVVAFNGSPRKDGNTNILINRLLREVEREGIETELVQGCATWKLGSNHLLCSMPSGGGTLSPVVFEA